MQKNINNQYTAEKTIKKAHILATLVLFFVISKCAGMINYGIIAKDGVTYANLAKGFCEHGLKEALHIIYPPLYSISIGLTAYFIKPIYNFFPTAGKYFDLFELSAIAASTFFFVLLVVSVYITGKKKNPEIALLSSLFVLAHPLIFRFSTEVLSETFFALLLFIGTYSLVSGSKKRPIVFTLLSAFSFGLSYYVKPEGIAIAILLFIVVIIFDRDYRKHYLCMILFTGILLLIISPYIFYLYKETGKIILSDKQNIVFYLSVKRTFPSINNIAPSGALAFTISHPLLAFKKLSHGLFYTVWNLPEAFFRIYFIFFIISVFSKNNVCGTRKIIFWFVALYFVAISFYNTDRRYFIPFIPILSFDIASGFMIFRKWLNKYFRRDLTWWIISLTLIISAFKAVPSKDTLKASIKKIGLNLKAIDQNTLIASNDIRLAFYAKGKHYTAGNEPLMEFLIKVEKKEHAVPKIIVLHKKEDAEILSQIHNFSFIKEKLKIKKELVVNGEEYLILSNKKISTGSL